MIIALKRFFFRAITRIESETFCLRLHEAKGLIARVFENPDGGNMPSCKKEEHMCPKCGMTYDTKEKLMDHKKKEHM